MRGSIGGYVGNILHVDLLKQDQRVEEISTEEARAYIGGSGLAAKRLWEMTGKDTNPLGPENVLTFMTGPPTETKVPLSGRHEVVAKSPLTEIYGESDVGGRWGTELGANTLVDDLEAVAKAHELCNRYGLGVSSTGAVVGFALEAAERGILAIDENEETDLKWGNAKSIVKLVEKIGRREGLGYLLGEGVMRASAKLGKGSEAFALHVEGLEPPGHDARAYNSLSVGYATGNRGACHLQEMSYAFERSVTMPELGIHEVQDRFGVVNKGELVAKTQDLMSLFDSLKLCKFLLFGGVKLTHVMEWFNAVTGWETSQAEFLKAGERIYNLKRMYNVRCGITRKDDIAPTRMLQQKRGEGGSPDNLPPFSQMVDEYYRYRGWNESGVPRREKLQELGLSQVVGQVVQP